MLKSGDVYPQRDQPRRGHLSHNCKLRYFNGFVFVLTMEDLKERITEETERYAPKIKR